MIRNLIFALLMTMIFSQTSSANPITHMLKTGWRSVFGHGSRTAIKEGGKQLTKQAVSKATRHTAKTVAQSRTASALRHFGNKGVRVGSKLATKAPAYADDLARVSKSLTAQNHRRLIMLAPELKKTGQAGKVIKQLAKSKKADEVLEFLWRHRGKLATLTVASAAAIYADDLAKAGGEYFMKPIIDNCFEYLAKPMVGMFATLMMLLSLVTAVLLAFKFTLAWRFLFLIPGLIKRQLYIAAKFFGNIKSCRWFDLLVAGTSFLLPISAQAQPSAPLPILSADQRQQIVRTVGPWAKWLTDVCEHPAFGPVASIFFFLIIITYSKRTR